MWKLKLLLIWDRIKWILGWYIIPGIVAILIFVLPFLIWPFILDFFNSLGR